LTIKIDIETVNDLSVEPSGQVFEIVLKNKIIYRFNKNNIIMMIIIMFIIIDFQQ
jgi:hypothetical protein